MLGNFNAAYYISYYKFDCSLRYWFRARGKLSDDQALHRYIVSIYLWICSVLSSFVKLSYAWARRALIDVLRLAFLGEPITINSFKFCYNLCCLGKRKTCVVRKTKLGEFETQCIGPFYFTEIKLLLIRRMREARIKLMTYCVAFFYWLMVIFGFNTISRPTSPKAY